MSLLLQATIDIQSQGQGKFVGSTATDNTAGFAVFLSEIMQAVMVVAALLLLLYLLWGAIEWITAGGEQSKIQSARDRITQAIVGILVLASVVALFNMITWFLGLGEFFDTTTSGVRSGGSAAGTGGSTGGSGSSGGGGGIVGTIRSGVDSALDAIGRIFSGS